MERVWKYMYAKLKVQSEEHPVLLTEPPLNPRKMREKAAELFFETFNVPAFFVALQSILSMYASGRTTGIVLDSGDGVTHAVPIVEGFAIPHAVLRSDLAGRDVTDHLMWLLRKSGYSFYTSAEKEIVRTMKENVCLVTDKEKKLVPQPYKLPDGSTIELGPERYQAPELLFTPHVVGEEQLGVPDLVAHSIGRCDIDLRNTLYSNVLLTGGSTLFPGFGQRLLNEVKVRAPKDTFIKIIAPPERIYSTWAGGSLLASLSNFKKMWVSRAEYDADGPSAIHRRSLFA
eukprot:TRINITY_DN6288_c2_g1_i3.p1 TRINITY_DN6288_c2_g1~~TRINITY_DN6288_c2_g1_i3.p1  ORF type:complete len:287 (+),score=70.19 TRINITY_DN6288_c2_g1_i3:343-1203(+)